jgi:hypothetical protein
VTGVIRALAIGVLPAIIIAGLLLYLNWQVHYISSTLAPGGATDHVEGFYGWPKNCCTIIRSHDGHTRYDYDFSAMQFNIFWCIVATLVAWLVTAFACHSYLNPKDAAREDESAK